MITANILFDAPFPGHETVDIESVEAAALWRVETVPLFSDEIGYHDIVVIDYKSMAIVDVVTPGGFTSIGLVYKSAGAPAEIEARFLAIRDHLRTHGIALSGKIPGIAMMAVPLSLSAAAATEICQRAPETLTVSTAAARRAYLGAQPKSAL